MSFNNGLECIFGSAFSGSHRFLIIGTPNNGWKEVLKFACRKEDSNLLIPIILNMIKKLTQLLRYRKSRKNLKKYIGQIKKWLLQKITEHYIYLIVRHSSSSIKHWWSIQTLKKKLLLTLQYSMLIRTILFTLIKIC